MTINGTNDAALGLTLQAIYDRFYARETPYLV